MALGKTKTFAEGKAFSLRHRLKDGTNFVDVGFFEVQEKKGKDAQGKDIWEKVGRETDVAGDLVRLDTRVGEYEGNPVRSFTLTLRDAEKNEVYFTTFSLGSALGRSTANSVLNLKNFTNVQFSNYGQINKQTKKTYPALSVRQGDDSTTVKWKYDPKAENSEYPKAREYVGKGNKTEYDYTAQEEFLLNKLNEFAKVIEAGRPKGNSPRTTAATTTTPTGAPASENLDEDVPFN